MSDETLHDLELLRDAAREVSDWQEKPRNVLRFAPRRIHDDRLSTKAAPGPKGGSAADDVEWAKARRRQRAEEERGR